MFAQATYFAAAPLQFVNADIASRDYVDARAPCAGGGSSARFCAPDVRKPNCLWNSIGPAARTAVRRMRRASPERAVCRGDEE